MSSEYLEGFIYATLINIESAGVFNNELLNVSYTAYSILEKIHVTLEYNHSISKVEGENRTIAHREFRTLEFPLKDIRHFYHIVRDLLKIAQTNYNLKTTK